MVLVRKRLFVLAVVWLSTASVWSQQSSTLTAVKGKPAERRTETEGYAPSTEVVASFRARLTRADGAKKGEAWLEVSADAVGKEPAHVTLRIPLSSTADAYGESRSCMEGPGGGYEPVFTAGLDEKNFVGFSGTKEPHDYRLLLNKYLCRAMAAPFDCFGHRVSLPRNWDDWRLAKVTEVRLSSDAASEMTVSPIAINASRVAFNRARCAVVAPSNGLCCVHHKTTKWHCGGKPEGAGWHQVSGDCWHRETGGSCSGD